jgi:proline iminopeptidase
MSASDQSVHDSRGVSRRRIGHVRRGAAAGAAMLVATAAGFGGTLAVAAATANPALFLGAGGLLTALVAAGLLELALKRIPRIRRTRSVAWLVGGLVALGAAAVLVPLGDARDPAAVPGLQYWSLATGSRLAYVRMPGAEPRRATPIVVLHGGPGIPDMAGDAAYFGRLSALRYDVYVYDQLGSGHSTRLPDPTGYGVGRDVADLEAVRQTIGAQQMVLVGHSYGGALAAHYLAAHPDRVEKLVLSSPMPLDPADTSPDRATSGLDTGARLRTYAAALRPRALLGYLLMQVNAHAAHAYLPDSEADARNDTILTLAEPALHCTPAQARGSVRGSGFYRLQYPQSPRAPAPHDPRRELTGLPTPVLIFKGSCDYLSWRSALDYRRTLPHTGLVYLAGAGHNTYQDRPTEVLADITAFLTEAPLPIPVLDDDAADHLEPPATSWPR